MKSSTVKVILILLLLILNPTACSATKTITIENSWARPALSGDNGAVYFVIQNPGPNDDAIISVSSPVAAKTEIHESIMDSAGTMSMHFQHSVALPAGEEVKFEPGGFHVMLVSLNRDLKPGDSLQLTLAFENSGDQTIDVEIKQP